MTQAQAGWYADPWQQPGQPPAVRWWDGAQWTSRAQLAAPPGATAYQKPAPTTPDGAVLAGWWPRVGAVLLDGLILLPVFVLVSLPFWGDLADAYGDWWREFTDALDAGTDPPSGAELQDRLSSTLLALGLVSAAVNLVYYVAFLAWKRATPGKMIVGIRVRRRESDDLPLSTILVRWVATYGPYLLALVLVALVDSTLGALTGLITWLGQIYLLVDGAWPLWDPRRQALHDKAARTNVVVRAR